MRRLISGFVAGALVLLATSCDGGGSGSDPMTLGDGAAAEGSSGPPPNFVVILTDDQPFHTMWAMPEIDALAAQGVRFTEAFVEMPVCAPPRASFLSGGFHARETGVVWNGVPNGGAKVFREDSTLGTRLQAAGYRTGYVGKWMNEDEVGHVPPGWDRYVNRDYKDGVHVGYHDYRLYHYRDHALDFLDEVGDDPFLLVFSVLLPHYPAIPAPGDETLYESYLYRDRGFGESDISDKPPVIQTLSGQPSEPGWTQDDEDEFHRDQLRSLAAVDRAVGDLFARLDSLGVKNRTYVFFWTDQGLQWGEHGLTQKDYAYDESIRTPLLAWGPDVVPQDRGELIMAPLDIAATILDLSGAGGPTDGRSLRPLLRNETPGPAWRKEVFLEFVTSPFVWAGVRTDRWKYVEWGEGDVELYDLQADPYELENLHDDPAYAAVLSDLQQRRAAEPRALAFREPRYRLLPVGRVGVPYAYQLRTWGGQGRLTFSLSSGVLPAGLALSSDGLVSGTPTEPQVARESLFDIRVCDSTERRHQSGPHCFTKTLDLSVNPSR
jgi:arylsulfatase A-like enzyme